MLLSLLLIAVGDNNTFVADDQHDGAVEILNRFWVWDTWCWAQPSGPLSERVLVSFFS